MSGSVRGEHCARFSWCNPAPATHRDARTQVAEQLEHANRLLGRRLGADREDHLLQFKWRKP
jgi:hypothetical protein